ncbi:MAG: DsbA family protein [Pyrinomonadaceae bacterium]
MCQDLGIDYSKLQKDMADSKIEEQLARTSRLAGSLDIKGTPAYIVGEQIIPGAIDETTLANILADARARLITSKTREVKGRADQ